MQRRLAVLVVVTTARTASASPAVEVEPAVGTAFEMGAEYASTNNGLSLAAGVGGFVSSRVALLGRVRISKLTRFYTASIGPAASVEVAPKVWLSGGIGVVWVDNFHQHCFAHPDGGGPQVSLGAAYELSPRIAFGLSTAMSRTEHTDLEVMLAMRVHWYSPPSDL